MANVKISNLPSYTGTSSDLRWFVMNNSGETTTFKFSGYTSPLKSGNGIGSVVSNYYNPNATPGFLQQIIGGTGNTMSTTSSYTFVYGGPAILGGYNNSVTLAGDQQPNGHYGHTIVGGTSNEIRCRFNGENNSIIGGANNLINSVYGKNAIISSTNSQIQGNSTNVIVGGGTGVINGTDVNGIFGGFGNTINSSTHGYIFGSNSSVVGGNYSSVVGGTNSNIAGTNAGFIGGGRYNTLDGGNSDSNYLIGSQYARAQGIGSGVLGGWGTYIYDDGNNNDPYRRTNSIIGSPYSEIGVSNNNGRNFGGIYSSLFSYIRGTSASQTRVATIFGSSGSTIQGGSQYVSIIGGYNNTITGNTNVAMIGTNGRTASRDNATFVENLVVFDYANLNFADDTAAAAGGVVLGQIYHNNGAMRIRIV